MERLAILALALGVASCSGRAPATVLPPTASETIQARFAPGPAPASITLVSQSSFVRAGGDFDVIARIAAPDTEVEAVASVFPAVANRTEFARALREPLTRLPLFVSPPALPDPEGLVAIRLPLQDPAGPRDPERARIGRRNGVHPVVVELRDREAGPVRNRMVTFLTYLVEPDPTTPLLVSLVVPADVPVVVAPVLGGPVDNRDSTPALAGLAAALEAARGLPVTFAPTPYALDTLAGNGDEATAALARLRAATQLVPVVARPYVPIDLPAMIAAGLTSEIDRQFARGGETTAAVLGRPPNGRTWVSEGPLDGAAIDYLALDRDVRDSGVADRVTAMVMPERLLVPVARQVTLTSPFLVRGRTTEVPALAADDGLATHFAGGDQTLRAHQLLADLAVLYLDLPGSARGAVALPPPRWTPTTGFFAALRSGLTTNPVLRPASLDELFDLPMAEASRSLPLVRRAAERPGRAVGFDPSTTDELRRFRGQVEAVGTIFPRQRVGDPATPPVAALDKVLLAAESSEVASDRDEHLARFRDAVARQKGQIRIPQGRSVTLTSREGSVPVTFQNDTGLTALVRVRIASDKLLFPDRDNKPITLSPRLNTTDGFRVLARTSGSFPVEITVESPDGMLTLGQADLIVRSTAAPGLGLGIAVGAAAFLVVWWSRNAHSVRRARRLVTGSSSVPPEDLP